MRDFNVKERWLELKDALRPMPWNKKLEHLWEYYKWVLVVLIVAAVIIYIVAVGYSNARVEGLFYGEVVNLDFDMAGVEYLREAFLEHLGGVQGDQKVSLNMSNLVVGPDSTYDNYYAPLIRTSSEISNGKLDYLLVDSAALTVYFNEELFLDLREVFTADELAQMGDTVVYVLYEETGEKIPMAINVTDSAFMTSRLNHKTPAYLGFVANTTRQKTCKIFYNYFMAYQPE
jgi:hypothetical protein